MEVYKPREDSYLLAKHVDALVHGDVLDMGTGSGIQAVTAARKTVVRTVTAVDVNPAALKASLIRAQSEGVQDKIIFTQSDLFSNVRGKFNWILFNAPYLPSEGKNDEASWTGGEKGGEIIIRFLNKAPQFLAENGAILMIYSSLSNLNCSDFSGYKYMLLEKKNLFFEKIMCISLTHLETYTEANDGSPCEG